MAQNIIDIGFSTDKFNEQKGQVLSGLKEMHEGAQELSADFKKAFESLVAASNTKIGAGATGGLRELKDQVASLQSSSGTFKNITANSEEYAAALSRVTDRVAQMNGQSKEFTQVLLTEAKATKELSASKLNDAKATTEQSEADLNAAKASSSLADAKLKEAKTEKELSAAKLNDAKTRDIEQKAIEREAAATDKAAKAKEKEAQNVAKQNEPYNKLAIQFAAAAREAKNLAAQYGTTDKRAQDAARHAMELNDQLKNIDATIGNHQREVGNYGMVVEGASEKIKHFAMEALSLVGIFSVASFFKDSIDEFLELDKTMRILQNTLRNVGAPELFGRIEERTKDLTRQFKFLKDEDIASSFNKLIVYGKLTEKQINELIPVIIDFATATGQQLPEATGTVIKALEGNGKALKEFGINMKDAKNVTEGFDLVMKELKPRVDGVAEAFGESAAGKIAATKEEFIKLKEEVGSGLIPILVKLLEFTSNAIKGLNAFAGAISDAIKGSASLVGSFMISTFKDNQSVLYEIESARKVYISGYENFLKRLNELHKEGKKLNVTEKDLIDEQIKHFTERKKYFEEQLKTESKKQAPSFDVLAGAYEQVQAIDSVIADLQSRLSKGIIGPGDPNKGKGGVSDKERKEFEDGLQAEYEAYKLRVERRAELNLEIAKDEKKSYKDRLDALNTYGNLKKMLIDAEADHELEVLDKKTEGLLKTEGLTAEGRLRIESNYSAQVKVIREKQLSAIQSLAKSMSDIFIKTADAIKQIGKAYTEGIKGMTKSIEKQIDDLAKKAQENAKAFENAIKKRSELEVQAAEEVANTVQAIGDSKYEREKNRIQSLIDANNEYAQAETNRITNSTLSEQDKAAKLIQLQAITDAKNKQLAREQKEQDIKKAKFDKAFSILNIVESTAQNEVQALSYLSNPVTAPLYPGIAALIGTIGALKLAVAIGQQIPTYAKGTQDHPGGVARFGEAGPEAVVLPGGKTFIADEDTTGYLPKHTKVVPLTVERINDVMYGAVMANMSDRMVVAEKAEQFRASREQRTAQLQTDKIVDQLKKMDTRPIVRNHVNIGADFHLWVNKYVNGK